MRNATPLTAGPTRPGSAADPAAAPTVDALLERLGPATAAAPDGAPAGPRDCAAAPAGGTPVTGVSHDSRAVRPGDLYAALPGSRVHGASFVAQAVGQGAVAVLTDPEGARIAAGCGVPVIAVPDPRAVLGGVASWVHGHPTRDLLVIGTTGTNGKTTVSYLAEAGLRAAGRRTGLVGTVETRIGDEVVPSVRTTPEAPELQALFAAMRGRGVDAVAMEVSSHALVMGRVNGTAFDVAVFTNLSQDHLDFHHDMESYFQAKALLFTPGHSRAAVINLDDAHGRRLADTTPLPVTTYSAAGDPAADWRAEDLHLAGDRSTFRAVGRAADGRIVAVPVTVPMPGRFNVANALAALTALAVAGIDPDQAAAGIGRLGGVPGRMERVDAGQPFTALVDYAHTPDAVETLLRTLRPVTTGRLVAVLGCGGDRDATKRPLMGAVMARLADVAILTSDNPRSEDPGAILAAMRAGAEAELAAGAAAEVLVRQDRAEAIATAVGLAAAGDTVVVAGKGHEQGQETAGVVRPFDDRTALRDAIAEARGGASDGGVAHDGASASGGTGADRSAGADPALGDGGQTR